MTRVRERAEGSDEHKKDFFFWLTNKIDAENGEEYPMEELKEEVILLITGGMLILHTDNPQSWGA